MVGKSAATVKRLAKAGTIPAAFKLAGSRGAYVFRRSDVEAYMATLRNELLAEAARLEAAS